MSTKRLLPLALAGALSLLASCGGGHDGVELGEFPALNKTEGDEPFKLTAPTSKSPAAFSYTSSDPAVASIAGDMVTIHKDGTSTITAQQGRMGSYYPTSTSALLTVAVRVCTAPAVKEKGVCVLPAGTGSNVTSGGLVWTPATATAMTWAAADAFCKSTKIDGASGRLPTHSESTALVASRQLNGKEWLLADTWTSNADTAQKTHTAVSLATGVTMPVADDKKISVTCVR